MDSEISLNTVKYEVVGQITGNIDVTYHDNFNGSNIINNISAPWSIGLQYGSEVTEVGVEATGYVTGNPGQAVTFNIYINNALVKTHTSISERSGKITIPLLTQSL